MFQVTSNIRFSLKSVTHKRLAWKSYSKPRVGSRIGGNGEIQDPKTKQSPNQRKQSGLIDHGLPENISRQNITTNLIQWINPIGAAEALGAEGSAGG